MQATQNLAKRLAKIPPENQQRFLSVLLKTVPDIQQTDICELLTQAIEDPESVPMDMEPLKESLLSAFGWAKLAVASGCDDAQETCGVCSSMLAAVELDRAQAHAAAGQWQFARQYTPEERAVCEQCPARLSAHSLASKPGS